MRLVIDASAMALRQSMKAGIYRYGKQLLTHLPEALPEGWELNTFFHFFRQRHVAGMKETIAQCGDLPNICSRVHPSLTKLFRVPTESLCGPMDLLHGPFDRVGATRKAARVVSIHDLAFLRAPAGLPRKWVEELKHTVPQSAKRAHAILTASEFSKSDIVEWLRVPAERVHVVPHGVTEGLRPPADSVLDQKRLLQRYDIQPGYILYLGTLQPNKNIENLCSAFQHLRRGGFRGQLVLAGREGWLFESMWKQIHDRGDDENVIRTGFVEEEDIPRLYGSCACFALVSVLEGFGIPIIEAMACGAPVVVADSCSLPEVAGGAGVLADPWNPKSIAEALEEAMASGEEQTKRKKLGFERAARFTWNQSAQGHVAMYRAALEEAQS
ncbi:MAG: glycosyltransferase family 4 protein [Planctomycetes bacterium]|nr:glycosyltransferase family 4 protein [Planctomycetota bacterium]